MCAWHRESRIAAHRVAGSGTAPPAGLRSRHAGTLRRQTSRPGQRHHFLTRLCRHRRRHAIKAVAAQPISCPRDQRPSCPVPTAPDQPRPRSPVSWNHDTIAPRDTTRSPLYCRYTVVRRSCRTRQHGTQLGWPIGPLLKLGAGPAHTACRPARLSCSKAIRRAERSSRVPLLVRTPVPHPHPLAPLAPTVAAPPPVRVPLRARGLLPVSSSPPLVPLPSPHCVASPQD